MRVLVTGGAGFIGSHTVDALLRRGDSVRILDSLARPVHLKGRPSYLPAEAEFVLGDVRDAETVRRALDGIDAVFHFAAYQDYLPDFSTFFHVNAAGTAMLYEQIVGHRLPVRKIVVASSQAVAGEGLYRAADGTLFCPDLRPRRQLEEGRWDFVDERGRPAPWVPAPETTVNPQNAYGLSKLAQERLALALGRRYEIPTVAMRYSIVQGARQSLHNAYSGACRIFCLSVHLGRAPAVYEDGRQRRDFVNVADVVRANLLVLDDPRADFRVFNVGGGRAWTVLEFAEAVCRTFGKPLTPRVAGAYRFGDTRHAVSDVAALRALGWEPRRTAEDSIAEYIDYLRQQPDVEDALSAAERTMRDMNVLGSVEPR